MPVKRTKSKRDCSIVKVLSVIQMRQQEDERHNAKGSRVCFQRILSEIKSIPGSGTVQRSLSAFCHGLVIPWPWAASLTLQVIYLSVLHQSHPIFSENTIYLLFVSLARIFCGWHLHTPPLLFYLSPSLSLSYVKVYWLSSQLQIISYNFILA